MAAEGVPSAPDSEARAHRSADQLALALEEVGFDVAATSQCWAAV